jgi:hypothetical protein
MTRLTAGGKHADPKLGPTVVLGTIRTMPCRSCSAATRTPTVRPHAYSENRTWRQVERFWECIACGHQVIIETWREVPEAKTDPETELLHAQWREDNRGLCLHCSDHGFVD